MGVILLLAGVLLLIFGGASFATQPVAARRPLRQRSRGGAFGLLAVGVVLVVLGGAQLLA